MQITLILNKYQCKKIQELEKIKMNLYPLKVLIIILHNYNDCCSLNCQPQSQGFTSTPNGFNKVSSVLV